MPTTINLNKGGAIVGTQDSTQAAARDEASGTSIGTGGVSNAVQYFASSGRGGGVFRYTRSFLQFDTSSITGTVSEAILNIESHSTQNDSDVIICASDAFGGTNDDLINNDFNNVDFSTAYSSELTTWNASGSNNAITLNAAARSIIQSGNSFICVAVDHDADFQDTDTQSGSGADSAGINFSGTITLVVTVASGYGNNVSGVASANISKIDGVATANIEKVINV